MAMMHVAGAVAVSVDENRRTFTTLCNRETDCQGPEHLSLDWKFQTAARGESMKAVVMHETGDPDVLRLEEVEQPEPGEGEVLIAVHAASVNPVEVKQRRARDEPSLPTVLGYDVSGVIEDSRAQDFAEDDEVFGRASSGSYAQFAIARAGEIVRKPSGISHEQAAAIPVAGGTAWQALFDVGGLESGQTALIAGAAGGVGHFAVQFAKHAGARVIGTGSARNRDFVLGLGADEYVDYTEQDVAEAVSDVDLALDTVGGETTEGLLPVLREGGILVTIAAAAPTDAARARGVRAESFSSRTNPEQLARIAELVDAGEVRIELAEVLPLSEIRRAHELSESGHMRGKIVLTVDT
jgi:NADPH:quinone reductase-like Zn-dependent oxidoreductase